VFSLKKKLNLFQEYIPAQRFIIVVFAEILRVEEFRTPRLDMRWVSVVGFDAYLDLRDFYRAKNTFLS
jgi:hypothetical protein